MCRCVMLPKFNAADVWTWLLAIEQFYGYRVNMFMGVPTMYVKLIEHYEKTFEKNDRMVEYVKAVCSQKIRQVFTKMVKHCTQRTIILY